jgi:cation diffusion facilitator CzcD-associated flavoprotein CzcO
VPLAEKLMRSAWFWGHESVALGVVWDSPFTRVVEALSLANLRRQVKDPWLRRQLTPDFSAGCKRLLMTADYYPALQADNCKLVTWPIARLSPKGIRTVEGIEHQFDAIVFATGFEVSKAGTPFPVIGIDGRELAAEWSRGAYAYRSVAVSGYPNLYFTFGPNSGPGQAAAVRVEVARRAARGAGPLQRGHPAAAAVHHVELGLPELVPHRGRLQRDDVPRVRHPVRQPAEGGQSARLQDHC